MLPLRLLTATSTDSTRCYAPARAAAHLRVVPGIGHEVPEDFDAMLADLMARVFGGR